MGIQLFARGRPAAAPMGPDTFFTKLRRPKSTRRSTVSRFNASRSCVVARRPSVRAQRFLEDLRILHGALVLLGRLALPMLRRLSRAGAGRAALLPPRREDGWQRHRVRYCRAGAPRPAHRHGAHDASPCKSMPIALRQGTSSTLSAQPGESSPVQPSTHALRPHSPRCRAFAHICAWGAGYGSPDAVYLL